MTEATAPRPHSPLVSHRAVLGEGPDSGVPLHYGAPLREQRRLLDGRACVDLGHIEILEVGGEDRATWLTTVSSQVFTDLRPGDSTEVTVLSPQGRVEHWAQVITLEDSFLFLLDAGAREGLRTYFAMMTFANRIELTDRDDLRAMGATVPLTTITGDTTPLAQFEQRWPDVAPGGLAYGPDPQFAEPWFIGVFDAAELSAAVGTSISRDSFAGLSAAEAIRIVSHRPRFAREVDAKTIPHELDLLRTAIHTNKGCYRGQETVAKVMNLGQPPRRLVMLHLDGSQDIPVPVGVSVHFGAKNVGVVTSSALHADEGPVALALVKRALPLDAALTVSFTVGEADADSDNDASVLSVDAAQEPIVVARDHGARPETTRLGVRAETARLG